MYWYTHGKYWLGISGCVSSVLNIHHVNRWVKCRGWHLFPLNGWVDCRQDWRNCRLWPRSDHFRRNALFLILDAHINAREVVEERAGVKRFRPL